MLYSEGTKKLIESLNKSQQDTLTMTIIDTDFEKSVKQECISTEFLDDLRWVLSKHGIIAIEGGIIAFDREVEKVGITNAHIISEREKWDFGAELLKL